MAELIRERRNDALERHIQTLIGGLILASVLWAGSSLQRLQEAVVRAEERAKSTQEMIARNEVRISGAEVKIGDLNIRVDRLERKEGDKR